MFLIQDIPQSGIKPPRHLPVKSNPPKKSVVRAVLNLGIVIGIL